ncbi:MAG: hypothetical protein AB8G11_02330 [Saprospiraceae bacterium]
MVLIEVIVGIFGLVVESVVERFGNKSKQLHSNSIKNGDSVMFTIDFLIKNDLVESKYKAESFKVSLAHKGFAYVNNIGDDCCSFEKYKRVPNSYDEPVREFIYSKETYNIRTFDLKDLIKI